MALKRYIGPAEAVQVRLMGEDYGLVNQGEALAVPDDLADKLVWAPDLWEDVASPSKKESDR